VPGGSAEVATGTAGQRARLLAESRAPLVLRTDGREQGAPPALATRGRR
jgi:hypothetical protein